MISGMDLDPYFNRSNSDYEIKFIRTTDQKVVHCDVLDIHNFLINCRLPGGSVGIYDIQMDIKDYGYATDETWE